VGRVTLEVVIVAETVGKGTTGIKGGGRARTRGRERERGTEKEAENASGRYIGYEEQRGGGRRCNHRVGGVVEGGEEEGRRGKQRANPRGGTGRASATERGAFQVGNSPRRCFYSA